MLLQTNLRPNGEHIEIDESSFSGQRQVDMIYYQKFYHDSCINFDESWPNYKTKLLNMCGLCFTSTTFNIHTQRERGDNITCRWPCCVYATKYIFRRRKNYWYQKRKTMARLCYVFSYSTLILQSETTCHVLCVARTIHPKRANN